MPHLLPAIPTLCLPSGNQKRRSTATARKTDLYNLLSAVSCFGLVDALVKTVNNFWRKAGGCAAPNATSWLKLS